MDIAGLLPHHARYRPHRAAIVFEDQRLSWIEFDARVRRCARGLQRAGVVTGDRVAMVLPNCLELLLIYWAAARIGAIAVPLSPLLTATGLESLLADAAPAVLVASRATAPVVAATTMPPGRPPRRIVVDGAPEGAEPFESFEPFERFLEAGDAADPGIAVAPEDIVNIMYTSGTTGLPKGIVHTQRIRAQYGSLFASEFRITPESVVLHTGALIFNGAFVTMMPAAVQGACFVFHRQFDADALLDTVERERVTHTMLVPSQIIAVLASPRFDPVRLASLEVLLSLGAPLPVAHKETLEALLPGRFHELYGLTEGFVTILDRREAVTHRGSVGTPPPFFSMRIVREDGTDAPAGEVGEIAGRSPILMPGYYNRPDLTAQTIREGWLHTGDLGYVDDAGFLHLVDRKKDMIDSGGVKVYPRDIEEVIAAHPDVLESAVFGIPDAKWGETPIAAVTLRAGAARNALALREWINARVGAKYQRLARVEIIDSMPRNAAGKILKRALREPYWEGRGTRI